jgi:hypothetical protein
MTRGRAVRFDQALEVALAFCRQHRAVLGDETVVVRDIVGRIRIATAAAIAAGSTLWDELHDVLGAWSPGITGLHLVGSDLLDPDSIFKSPDVRTMSEGIRLLDRRLSERDWIPRPGRRWLGGLPAIAFFGVKGGVGRSTALSVVSRCLAEKGHRVLVVDLDLESPGVSTLLLPEDGRPPFGVVDWLVESGVGQADDELFVSMIATSPLASGTSGQIQVIPAAGEGVDTYVSKLARVQTSSDSSSGYRACLGALLDAIAQSDRPPTVVLLDCRAGIDDLAAAVITDLATDALLFAVGSPQTWGAYRMLFSMWNKDAQILASFRDKLRMVAGLVPETESDAYLERLRSSAYDLFSEFVYEEEPYTGDLTIPSRFDLFNFDFNDDQAPHYAIPVPWRRELQDFDPVHRPESEARNALSAFDRLTGYVEECFLPEQEPTRS